MNIQNEKLTSEPKPTVKREATDWTDVQVGDTLPFTPEVFLTNESLRYTKANKVFTRQDVFVLLNSILHYTNQETAVVIFKLIDGFYQMTQSEAGVEALQDLLLYARMDVFQFTHFFENALQCFRVCELGLGNAEFRGHDQQGNQDVRVTAQWDSKARRFQVVEVAHRAAMRTEGKVQA